MAKAEEAAQLLAELTGRAHDINERTTMTFLDVRQLENRVTRIESHLERLEAKLDKQYKRQDSEERKLDLILRHLGLSHE